MTIAVNSRVLHVSGCWTCGCNEPGTVACLEDGVDFDEYEPMAFVGTGCGWNWVPVSQLRRLTES